MENVVLEFQGPVAVVTLNRPNYLNALNSRTYLELDQCFQEIQSRKEIRVVILTGAGDKAFAAGADISEMVHTDAMGIRRMGLLIRKVSLQLESMPQVTIAAVNGYALGGGCELSLACDLCIASENARFALPEIGLGIIPGGGGTQRLARLIGKRRAKELIFTCDQIDAREAYRIGLVNHVVPQADLMDACRTLADKLVSKASYAISLAKTSIETGLDTDLSSGLSREIDLLAIAFTSHDKQEGMTAFLEKRKPNFTDF